MSNVADLGGETAPKMLARLYKDVYFGNGKPGLCTRMEQAEDRMDSHSLRMNGQDTTIKEVRKMFWALILLILTLFGGVVTDIVVKLNTEGKRAVITGDLFTPKSS